MKALAVVEETDPQGTVVGVQGVVEVRESIVPLVAWWAMLAVWILLLAFACLQVPGHALEMSISGNCSGNGVQEHSLEAAGSLIEFTHDSYPDARSWCFLLESHGFETDGRGRMWINGTEYLIADNGTLMGAA